MANREKMSQDFDRYEAMVQNLEVNAMNKFYKLLTQRDELKKQLLESQERLAEAVIKKRQLNVESHLLKAQLNLASNGQANAMYILDKVMHMAGNVPFVSSTGIVMKETIPPDVFDVLKMMRQRTASVVEQVEPKVQPPAEDVKATAEHASIYPDLSVILDLTNSP